MRPTTRAAAVIMLVSLLAAACGTNAPAMPEPAGPLPPIENAATLPAAVVPIDDRWWTARAGNPSDCDAYLCVPAGIYQQQQADGDWCDWEHYPTGFQGWRETMQEEGPEAANSLVTEGYKDADWTLITLREGAELRYGPTKGAQHFSAGLHLEDAEGNWHDVPGDGQQRGCAEWVQVGTLDDAVPLPEPAKDECLQIIEEGEAAIARVEEIAEKAYADIEQMQSWDALWDALGEVATAFLYAEPRAERAGACYSFLGQTVAADKSDSAAWVYRRSWLELRKECLTLFEFAPAGFDCSRLGMNQR